MTMILPANKLFYCCSPIINHLKPFLSEGDDFADVNYREIFQQDFIELEQRALAMQLEHAVVQQVKYAMAALVDETILHSVWNGKIAWLGRPLQLDYFAEHLAGEGFFTRLDMLRHNCLVNCDLLEIDYICLQLGFAGIYRIRGEEFLQGLQVGLYQQIANVRLQQANTVRELHPKINKETRIYFELPFWMLPVVVLLCIIIISLSYLYAIDNQADKTVYQLDQYVDRVLII